jgi:hypothetical protein
MRRSAVVGAALVALAVLGPRETRGDGDLDRLDAMWRRGEYARVTQELIVYRENTGIRNPQIDYMIATSACRTPSLRPRGNEFFAWILQNYNLGPQNRALVERQRQLCSAGGEPERLQATAPAALVGISYHGKGGTEIEARGSGNSASTIVAAIPPRQFAQRLFVPSDRDRAVRSMATLLGPEYQIDAVGHFVLAAARAVQRPDRRDTGGPGIAGPLNAAAPSVNRAAPEPGGFAAQKPLVNADDLLNRAPPIMPAPPNIGEGRSEAPPPNAPPMAQIPSAPPRPSPGPSPRPGALGQQMAVSPEGGDADLNTVGNSLEAYLRFFISEYGMRPPSSLIAVYVTPTLGQLRDLARRLHGLDLAPGSIGYSFPDDQSMVGWASGKAYGTFAHELFHLLVRNNFGDIPPFLDEGMAALYEVSRFEGNRAVGVTNWRGDILKQGWTHRPSIRELVQMDRSAFDDVAGAPDQIVGGKQAVNHATARYLMFYLQERGQLQRVYHAFRNRTVNDHPAAEAVQLLQTTLGRSLDEVDSDFSAWFTAGPR